MELDLAVLEKQSTDVKNKKQIVVFTKLFSDLILDFPYNISLPSYTTELLFQ